jgi:hypothetical protein
MDQYKFNLNMETFNGASRRLRHESFLALTDCSPRGVICGSWLSTRVYKKIHFGLLPPRSGMWILTINSSLQEDPFWRLRRREETRISHLLRLFQFGRAIYNLPVLWKFNSRVALSWWHSQVKYTRVEFLGGSPESGGELWISFVTP